MDTSPRGGVSATDVYDAANSLISQGLNPTQVLVRNFLGRGSYSVISPLLRQWRQEQHACAKTQLPEGVNEELVRFGKKLWRCAVETANHQVVTERDQWTVEKNNLIAELEEFREVVQQLEGEADRRNDEIIDLKQQLTQSRVRCGELESQLSATEQKIKNSMNYIAQNMEPLRHESKRLKAENERLAEEVQHLRQGYNR